MANMAGTCLMFVIPLIVIKNVLHKYTFKYVFGLSNYVVCYVSKLTWDNRLGHPSEQALFSFRHKLKFSNEVLPPNDIFHKAKQTRKSFPIS